MNRFIDFTGHFHPVLVHLPIGFLLLAIVFQWMSAKDQYAPLKQAVRISFLLGALSAVLSCLTGLSLSSSGEYDASTLGFHKWFGIAVAVMSFVGYKLSFKPVDTFRKVVSAGIFVLILITGHLGGTLTHGEGFLTKGISDDAAKGPIAKPIEDVEEAIVFNEVIQPILINKCGNCHGSTKQKGGLRLDGKDWILKGGKEGLVYTQGNAANSELYKRVILDPLEEKHMPPKGKPQLTGTEMDLLHWWINSGAGFDKKVKETEQPDNIKTALLALESGNVSRASIIPATPVDKAPQTVIDALKKEGIAVSPVAMNSNYLQVSFVILPKPGDTLINLLEKISKQLIWLKLPGAQLSDNAWKTIAECKALTRLSIERSNINDTTVALLSALQQLQYLNVVGTKLTIAGVQQLKTLPVLTDLYLGQTAINRSDFAALQKLFPKTVIDSGNYTVSTLATDTQLLKPPPVKK